MPHRDRRHSRSGQGEAMSDYSEYVDNSDNDVCLPHMERTLTTSADPRELSAAILHPTAGMKLAMKENAKLKQDIAALTERLEAAEKRPERDLYRAALDMSNAWEDRALTSEADNAKLRDALVTIDRITGHNYQGLTEIARVHAITRAALAAPAPNHNTVPVQVTVDIDRGIDRKSVV